VGVLNQGIVFASGVRSDYPDVLTPGVCAALEVLAPFDEARRGLMQERLDRRARRHRGEESLGFMDAEGVVTGTSISVADARAGRFVGSVIPGDLQRQWVQGTGPAARADAPVERSIRNAAYALLSGADGWMFDGEDALGQLGTLSLDNQRNLRLAYDRDPLFLGVAEAVARDINEWARGALGRATIADWEAQIGFTTRIFRPRGLHLDDRHIRHEDGRGYSAAFADAAQYVVLNHQRLRADGASIVLYLPKIQAAAEASLWNLGLAALEEHLGLDVGTVKTYVLIEQVEASFQLMEIRAALAPRFVGFNTGRWDYINSVADALAGDPSFANPNISEVGMTYGYMRAYEDRVRRATNTPDLAGQYALWQGGMEANIPVGSATGVEAGLARAVAGAEREQREGASGKWVAHWKMVPIIRPVWERAELENQMGRAFPPLTYTEADAAALLAGESAPRTVTGARDLISVGLQYANAFEQGMQAAALKRADLFEDEDALYMMEDMATGEIRGSILWEWLHKAAAFTEADRGTGVSVGDVLTEELFIRLIDEEYEKLLRASDRDVYDRTKETTLPIARDIFESYVRSTAKYPWLIDILNASLDTGDLEVARARTSAALARFISSGERTTANPAFR
jgi:malate synthase